jgi:large subunit ribosomal protein L21
MYAVIKTGGKQYRVKEGDVLAVEKLPVESGRPYDFDQVLLIELADKVLLGTPFVSNAVVRATALENFKDEKVIVFKKKRKKQYRRTRGHRQLQTRVRVDEIVPDKAQAPERRPVAPVEKPAAPQKPAPVMVPAERPAHAEVKKAPKKPAPAAKAPEKHEKKAAKPAKVEAPKHAKKPAEHKPAAKPKKTSK